MPLFSGALALQPLLGWGVLLLAAALADAQSLRVRSARRSEAARGLACAALAGGAGAWSSFVIAASARADAALLEYRVVPMLSGFALCAGIAAVAALRAQMRSPSHAHATASALAWGAGIALVHGAWAAALGGGGAALLRAAAVGLPAAALGGLGALRLLDASRRGGRAARALRAGAAAALTLAVAASQHAFVGAGLAPPAAGAGWHAPLATLLPLALVGATVLLGTMLLSTRVEAALRASLRRARAELRQQALTDPLTGLPTRAAFDETIAAEVRRADAARTGVGLLFVDVDGFKGVNEAVGHRSADRLLREIGDRLGALAAADAGLTLGRFGGDQFLLLVAGDATDARLSALALGVLDAVRRPCRLEGREVVLACSIGIATCPDRGGPSTLCAHADAAMRAAKKSGGDAHCFFEPWMLHGLREQTELLRDLRGALAQGQLALVYQPKIHGPSGEITGAEALVRWNHPQRGLIGPGVFIPIAERYGLINALGDWVVDEACRQIRAWRDAGLRMRIAVNLSVHQLLRPDLAARIAGALERHQVNPQLLTCEITESVAMEDADGTVRVFRALKDVGVHLSIDDFGTGYSSLSYLCKLPADELKIDRSFVLDLETSGEARAVVDAVVKLGQTLGMKVVAEGVEDETQHRILRDLGCDELQGFLFAKPMAPAALGLWAMKDEGPVPIGFRESLFRDTVPALA